MKRYAYRAASLAISLSLAGCANFNTAYRDFDIDDGAGAMVDIKQRAVIVSRQRDANGDKRSIVCAEPSPDALSAYAAELAAEGGNGQVSASLTAAMQESASFVGLRTQSIQLLRDSFYRVCEGYMSGALSREQFDILTRRHQRFMVALLGIEQLTGAVKAPAVTITTEGQAAAGQTVRALRASIEATNAEIERKEAQKVEQKGIADDDKKPKAERDAAAKKVKDLEEEIAYLKQDKADAEAGIAHARGLVAGGSGYAAVSSVGMPSQRSEQSLQEMAKTVGVIVDAVLNTDEFTELCLAGYASIEGQAEGVKPSILLGLPIGLQKFQPPANSNSAQLSEFGEKCGVLMDALVTAKSKNSLSRENLANALTAKLGANPGYSAEQVEALVKAFTAAIAALK
ncbi:MAG: hypothetical protein ABL957_10885 [Parvularculaceae bacterium]